MGQNIQCSLKSLLARVEQTTFGKFFPIGGILEIIKTHALTMVSSYLHFLRFQDQTNVLCLRIGSFKSSSKTTGTGISLLISLKMTILLKLMMLVLTLGANVSQSGEVI